MNIQPNTIARPTVALKVGTAAIAPSGEKSGPSDWVEIGVGAVNGTLHAVTWAIPGLVAGAQAARGKSPSEALGPAMGWQGVAAGAAAGFAVGGPIGAGAGAAIGGLAGMMASDFLWSEKASKGLNESLKPVLDGDASGERARTARTVRAMKVGIQSASKEAYRVGDDLGRGQLRGLQRGLAGVPEALTRDSSAELPALPVRGAFKQVIGLPLATMSAGVSALAGASAGLSRDPNLLTGLLANTALTCIAALGAAVVSPALSAVALPLLGVSLGGAVLGVAAHSQQLGERYQSRQYNDRALLPRFEDYSEPSGDNVANRREALIRGVAAGLKNGAIEGFVAGSRLTDPLVDGMMAAGKKVAATLAHLPEKLGGIVDGLRG